MRSSPISEGSTGPDDPQDSLHRILCRMVPASPPSAAALHPTVLHPLLWAVSYPLHTESWTGWGETDMVTSPWPNRSPSVWGNSPSARQRGWGAWVSLAPRPASGNISRGCSISHCLGHGHQGTCPTQFLSRTSTVITAALGFCTCVMKYVRLSSGQARWTVSPLPCCSAFCTNGVW